MNQMPRYRCHKEVQALKIAEVRIPSVECVFQIGLTTCGYTTDKHFKHGGGPMDHKFTPPAGILSVSPVLAFEDGTWREVSPEYISKHNPQAGQYYVVYDDGYESCSPAKAFEEGYTRL